jgi:hypothetical protein
MALLNIPEVASLLEQAVDPNSPISTTSFMSKLRDTNWFKGQSESQRNWFVTAQTDPGEARQQRDRYRTALTQFSKQLGVSLPSNLVKWLAEVGLQRGWEVDSPEMRNQIVRQWNGGDLRKGSIAVDAQRIRAVSEAEYFEPMSGKRAYQLALDIARGNRTMEEYQMRFQARAGDRFPHLKQRIINGESLAQIVEPYRNIVADELEMGDVGAVDMKNPIWRQLLGVKDTNGKSRMLSESEVITLARSQRQWWGTAKGQAADNGLTRKILQTFGARNI